MRIGGSELPRSLNGWRTLFWLSMGYCPVHHCRLSIDNPIYDDGRTGFCFKCKGIGIWPQNTREALRQNTLAPQSTSGASR